MSVKKNPVKKPTRVRKPPTKIVGELDDDAREWIGLKRTSEKIAKDLTESKDNLLPKLEDYPDGYVVDDVKLSVIGGNTTTWDEEKIRKILTPEQLARCSVSRIDMGIVEALVQAGEIKASDLVPACTVKPKAKYIKEGKPVRTKEVVEKAGIPKERKYYFITKMVSAPEHNGWVGKYFSRPEQHGSGYHRDDYTDLDVVVARCLYDCMESDVQDPNRKALVDELRKCKEGTEMLVIPTPASHLFYKPRWT